MRKRGFVDLDWSISLAIFLLYLAWFFIFINPFFDTSQSGNPIFNIIEDGVDDDLYWEVQRIPLIVESDVTRNNEPIIVNFHLNYSSNQFTFNPKVPFEILGDHLVMIVNLSKGQSVFSMYTSNETYTNSLAYHDIISDENYSITFNNTFFVGFADSFISSVEYDGYEMVTNMNISIQGDSPSINTTSYDAKTLFSKYHQHNDYFNLTTFVVSQNTRTFTEVIPHYTDLEYNITYEIVMPNVFTDFYLSNIFSGEIEKNTTACHGYESSYIDFYNSNRGISFIYENSTRIDFCYDNLTINMTIAHPIQRTRFLVFAHDSDYKKTINYTEFYRYRYGIKEKIKGLSLANMRSLNQTSYYQIKSDWNFPQENDFNLLLKNSTNNQNIEIYVNKEPPITEDVYVRDIYCQILDKDGNRHKCRLLTQVW